MKKIKERQKKRQVKISQSPSKRNKKTISVSVLPAQKQTQGEQEESKDIFDISDEEIQEEREQYAKFKISQSAEGLAVAVKHLISLGLEQKIEINLIELLDAIDINFLVELNGLNLHEKHLDDTFDGARLKLFKALSACLVKNPTNEFKDTIFDHIKNAGRKLYEVDGMRGLHDALVWLFIPDRWQSLVNEAFDGIGDWRA